MSNWTTQNMPDQRGRTILITGANSGLGYESALALAGKNAHVVMAVRNAKKGEAARDAIRREYPNASLDLMSVDMASLASIRDFAAAFRAKYSRLDVLMNNAGLMAPPRGETADGFEMQFGVNHLGTFAVTGLLIDLLIDVPNSRVVTVSSNANYMGRINFDDLHARKRYSRYLAYGQSKLANVLFAFELGRRLAAAGAQTRSIPVHPGVAPTGLQSTTLKVNNNVVEKIIYGIFNNTMAQSPKMGILPQLYAATDDAKPGEFWGPRYFHVRGYPTRLKANKEAYNLEVARRLWEVSVKETGVDYGILAERAKVMATAAAR